MLAMSGTGPAFADTLFASASEASAASGTNHEGNPLERPPVGHESIAPGAVIERVLGHYITNFPQRRPEHWPRAHNIRLAAGLLDGAVVEPGATFSFNEHVGPRSGHRGFRRAPIVIRGELDEGVGGGTCQVSSTLHAAVRRARLRVLDRTPHSRPSVYITRNYEATVSYPLIDFKFENTRTTPVIIRSKIVDRYKLVISIVTNEESPDQGVSAAL